MASQRNRPGRGGPRGATNDLTEEKDLWQQILPHLAALSKAEARAAEVNKEIFENEVQKKEKANAGISIFSLITHQEQS
jgi:SAGA-associated factor 29